MPARTNDGAKVLVIWLSMIAVSIALFLIVWALVKEPSREVLAMLMYGLYGLSLLVGLVYLVAVVCIAYHSWRACKLLEQTNDRLFRIADVIRAGSAQPPSGTPTAKPE